MKATRGANPVMKVGRHHMPGDAGNRGERERENGREKRRRKKTAGKVRC